MATTPDLLKRLEKLTPAQREQVLARLRAQAPGAIPRVSRDREIPLSFAQQRLWFLDQLSEGGAAYNVSGGVRLTGPLDPARLDRAIRAVIARHESLRTAFPAGKVVIAPPGDAGVLEIRDAAPSDVRGIARQEARRPFDLESGQLLRLLLLRHAPDDYSLLVTLHHIISDGWSLGVLIRELVAIYEARPLPPLPIQYADYAAWQRDQLRGDALARQLDYWTNELGGAPQFLELPTDRQRPPVQRFEGAIHTERLPRQLTNRVAAIGAEQGATPFMTFLAAFAVLLGRYSRQQDLLIGTPVANRTRSEIEGLIGLFVNTVVLRARLEGNPSFTEFLGRIRQTAVAAFKHQEAPFDLLVEKLQPERNLSHSPLFQVMFVLQNAHSAAGGGELTSLTMTPLEPETDTAKFDLTLFLEEDSGGLTALWEYSVALFDQATVARMAGHFRHLLESIAADATLPIGKLQLAPPVDRPSTDAPIPDRCFHKLFEEQAARTPDAIAAICGDSRLTYAELNARGNQLARHLRAQGIGREALVGLLCERSLELMIAVLAVHKAGAAYVPLDATYPAERRQFMLDDAQAALVLTRDLPAVDHYSTENLDPIAGLDDLAYVLYTSGSTGKPKGAEILHRGLTNYLTWAIEAYDVAGGTGAPVHSSISFDATITSWFAPLLVGKTVTLVPEAGELETLAALLQSGADYSLVKITPAHMEALSHILPNRPLAAASTLDSVSSRAEAQPALAPDAPSETHATVPRAEAQPTAAPQSTAARAETPAPDAPTETHPTPPRAEAQPAPTPQPTAARAFVIGGEALFGAHLTFWQTHSPATRLINEYGPTETVVGCCVYEARPGETFDGPVPIGRPIANTQLYVLDENLEPVPDGIPGELFIGGAGVARGYRNRPELTAARFLPNPFGPGRLYRTGDLVKYLPDGDLVYLGRLDDQVKVRGFRVELGEIEAALTQHPLVSAAAVIADGQRLVAYVSPGAPASELRAFLAAKLPDYMVPSLFVCLPALPLTPNGKIDRRALPAPSAPEPSAPVAPRTRAEERLAAIWSDVLGIPAIGVHDNFFDLGGHSLLAIQVVSRVRDAFSADLPLRVLFEAPTVSELAVRVEAAAAAAVPAIPRVPRDGNVFPMSFTQQRFWFLEQLEPGTALYVIPAAVRIHGPIARDAIARALNAVVARHESLRTTFAIVDGRPSQIIHPAFEIPILDDASALCRNFDLSRGPLLRAALVDDVLYLSMHHIVSDGWSIQVLVRELQSIGSALEIQYADFAVWQREWLAGDVRARQLEYWKRQLAGIPALLELPADRPRPAIQSFAGARLLKTVPADLRSRLRAAVASAGATEFVTMLAAFQVLLARLSGQDDVVVGSPFANRHRREIEPLIGPFVNTLALRGNIEDNPPFLDFVARVRRAVIDAQDHQDLPFELLVDELQPERNLGHSPIFQAMLVWENTRALALEGLTPLPVETGTAKFDLTLFLEDGPNGLEATWEYSTALFDSATVERFADHFAGLLESIAAEPSRPVGHLALAPAPERPSTEAPIPELCFHQLFEAQVAATPDAVAAICGADSLTYSQLNVRANQLARHLQAQGVGRESLVGLFCPRSLELMIAVLAVHKAGGAYVPLDTTYPAERRQYMLDDAGAALVLTRDLPAVDHYSPANLEPVAGLDDLAYVLYTSGSTGKPKGAEILHRGLTNYLTWAVQAYEVAGGTGAPVHSSISFDATITSWFVPLLAGKPVTLVPEGEELEALAALLQSGEPYSLVKITPAHMEALSHMLPDTTRIAARAFVIGGEALLGSHLAWWSSHAPATRMINEYGPTETVVGCCVYDAEPGRDYPGPVPIGRPIANTQLYVLDRRLQPVPFGAVGELYIGGAGVARGYRNRPGLTVEKFITNPFCPGRLYRTGDLVRYLPGGDLVYLGRIDNQVKIRGFRVELGEIEAILTQNPGISEAICVVDESSGHKRLIAYVVGHTDGLRAQIAAVLPDYMVPSQFVSLSAMPLTPNGKVDRTALPAPGAPAVASYTAPTTPVEETLARIWQEVLRIERVGVHDNFFELGGDSIVSIQMVSRAAAAGVRLTPKQVFQNQTIAALAGVAGTAPQVIAEQGPVEGDTPLTPIQHWFYEQNQPEPDWYNQSVILEADPATPTEVYEKAVDAVVQHHDVLRLGPPVRLERLSHDRILLVIHHLVVDGVSWRILLEDLDAALKGRPLPPKTSSYQGWARALERSVDRFLPELSYWQEMANASHAVPLDHRNTVESAERVTRELPIPKAARVDEALLDALAAACGPQVIDLESHGREPLFDELDLTRTVGWFTAIYPDRLGVHRRPVPNGGVGHGVLRYLGKYPGLESSARIKFNYLGRLDNVAGISRETRDDDVSPRNLRSHPIEVTAIVIDGRLKVAWEYCPHLDRREDIEAIADRFATALAKVETIYPLSPMQQGMLFESLLAPESGVYVEKMAVRLDGALDVERFKQAWRDVVARYDALRAEFRWQGVDQPEQIFRPEVELTWNESKLDLARAPLMRFALTQVSDRAWEFTWTYHHLLLDGWSRHRVVKDVVDLYAGNALAPAPPSYRSYLDWLRRQDPARAEAFWRAALGTFSAPTPLVVDLPGPASGTAVRHDFRADVRRLPGLTLNTVVQGAWALLLSRYSGQDDIVFGATVSGRPATLPGVEDMVGLFINTIPVRVAVDEDQPLLPWLAALQDRQVEADEFSWCSLIGIQSWSGVPRGVSLFESLVVFENYPAAEIAITAGGVTMSQARIVEQTNYPLVLVASPGDPLHLAIEYDPGRFDEATIRRMAGHLQTILSAVGAGTDQRVADLPLLTDDERRQLLVEWNSGTADHAHAEGKCAHELFAEQAARTPDAVAVVSDKGRLTFDELNRRANQVAHYLIRLGVGPESVVGVSMERSLETIVSCLGIWKAGGAYVPLDPSYPKDRLAFMIEDSGAAIVLTELPDLKGESDENPPRRATPDNLAYLIYTSGSTGKPKGVLIEQGSLVDHCCTMIDVYGHTPDSRVLLFVPLSFDQSVEDIFPTLLAGARVVLPRPGTPPSIGELLGLIEREGVTMLHMPTAYWHEWTSVLKQFPLPERLHRVKVGGEVAPLEPFRVFLRDARPGSVFANGYGPTETTVTSHFFESGEPVDRSCASVPIGRTLPNTLTYVLDRRGRLVPVGVPGELFIGGVRVGRGYKDRPELTAERFLPNPLGPGRVYRTGDSVRYLPDGNLEFLGRIDQQVKIRGFRIELGEVEALLNRHPAVRIAAVAARADQVSQILVAYLCPTGERIPDAELSAFLAERLPDYMIPTAYVWLDAMPVNPSGKIDRKALPAPQLSCAVRAVSAPPRDALEQRLVTSWSEVLDRDCGIEDNFFECGGHSLIAIRLVARVEQATGRHLPLAVLFERPTVAGIAEHLRQSDAAEDWTPLVPIHPRGSRPPFFCVHGGGGNVLHYYALSRELGPEQPFYALQAVGLDGRAAPLETVEAMAERYVREIRAVQPHGPYWLGGHSLGGQIAYEMAQQLRRAGEEVAAVAVMDTFAPGGKAAPIGEDWDDQRWLVELVDVIEQFLGVRLGIAPEEARLESVAEALRSRGFLPPGTGADMLRGLFRVFQANNRTNYRCEGAMPVPVVLFRGADSSDSGVHPRLRDDPAWGWNAYASRPVNVVFVPGDHIGMMTAPQVSELAERLGELLSGAGIWNRG